jgi:molecular chaperone GrpE
MTQEQLRSYEDQVQQLTKSLNDKEAEIAQLKEHSLRALAEAENIRKRTEKQIEETGKFVLTNFAKDLIVAVENLYRATAFVTPETLDGNSLMKGLYDGVEMTKREMGTVLEKYGIKRIYPELGSEFDHNFHQAVMHTATADAKPGSIIQVLQAGYTIKDRLLMPAMVGVAKEEDQNHSDITV